MSEAMWITEDEFCKEAGISRDAGRDLRDAVGLEHCGKIGKKNALSKKGAELASGLIGLDWAGLESSLEKKRADDGKGYEICTITKLYRNPRALEVEIKKKRVIVRVRNNRLFRIGQEIPVRKNIRTDYYVLACRQPSRRGVLRWKESE